MRVTNSDDDSKKEGGINGSNKFYSMSRPPKNIPRKAFSFSIDILVRAVLESRERKKEMFLLLWCESRESDDCVV